MEKENETYTCYLIVDRWFGYPCIDWIALQYITCTGPAPGIELAGSPTRSLLQAVGFITFLRVHNLGTGYGPNDDFIDSEVVIHLDSKGNQGFGFQLRDDEQQPTCEGMLNILRDAFNHDWLVTIDYLIEPGKNNGEIVRVWITKPLLEE